MKTKTFEEFVADYNPSGAPMNKVVTAFLRYLYENAGKDEMCMPVVPHGVVSKFDVYRYMMWQLEEYSAKNRPEGEAYQTYNMDRPIFNSLFHTDENLGRTEDNVHKQVRVIRNLTEEKLARVPEGAPKFKVVRKNAGGVLLAVIEDVMPQMPEELKTWTCEMYAQQWTALNSYSDYELHVDDKFWKIYNPDYLKGNFGSCMAKDVWHGNWTFYANSVKAHAAYITRRGESGIFARCVVFDDVLCEDTGEHFRMAERQYSSGESCSLKTVLVELLKANGHIDIHKEVGAGCGDGMKVVDSFSGKSLYGKRLSIECSLCNCDNVSYQDSFKFYSPREHRAYNKETNGARVRLDTTSPWFYNESTCATRPSGSWNKDSFHRRYLLYGRDYNDSSQFIDGLFYRDGVAVSLETMSYNNDFIKCEDGHHWYHEDVILYNGCYYPKGEFVMSVVDGCMIPKAEAVKLYNRDFCRRENSIQYEGHIFHKSELVYCMYQKLYSVKTLCVEVDGVWFLTPCEPFYDDNITRCRLDMGYVSDADFKVNEYVRTEVLEDGSKVFRVKCKNGRWTDVDKAEWDIDGWYDKRDYVKACYPVRVKSEDKDIKFEWKTRSMRKERAWKCKDGKWYDRYSVARSVMDGTPMAILPGIKFKGKLNDDIRIKSDWVKAKYPLREGFNGEWYDKYNQLEKAFNRVTNKRKRKTN